MSYTVVMLYGTPRNPMRSVEDTGYRRPEALREAAILSEDGESEVWRTSDWLGFSLLGTKVRPVARFENGRQR